LGGGGRRIAVQGQLGQSYSGILSEKLKAKKDLGILLKCRVIRSFLGIGISGRT
jgi:hypothetical protein